MGDSNNKSDLIYQVSLSLRGDLPVEERHKDGITRATKAVDMIQNLEKINPAFNDFENLT